jgi:hypothetical protein
MWAAVIELEPELGDGRTTQEQAVASNYCIRVENALA